MEIEKTKGLFSMKSDYPLKPEEYPTLEEKNRSNSVSGLNDQRGKVLNPVAIGLGSTALVAAGTLAVMAATHVIDIGSFTNSLNPADGPQLKGLPPHLQNPTSFNQERVNPAEVSNNSKNNTPQSVAETTEVNREVFDNTLTKGTFTERNTVAMTPKQYQDTSPQVIKGDNVVMPLPIEFPEGVVPKVEFKRGKEKIFGGQRFINGRLENGEIVSDGTVTVDDVIILSGIPIGSVLLSPWEGEIEFASSSGYENPTDSSLKLAAFSINANDASGNNSNLTFSTVKFKPLIEPSRIEYEEGTNHTKLTPKKPIKLGDPIGIILTTNYDNPYLDGQVAIKAISHVEENGQKQGGAAGIKIATTPEGQAIRLDRNLESE